MKIYKIYNQLSTKHPENLINLTTMNRSRPIKLPEVSRRKNLFLLESIFVFYLKFFLMPVIFPRASIISQYHLKRFHVISAGMSTAKRNHIYFILSPFFQLLVAQRKKSHTHHTIFSIQKVWSKSPFSITCDSIVIPVIFTREW